MNGIHIAEIIWILIYTGVCKNNIDNLLELDN